MAWFDVESLLAALRALNVFDDQTPLSSDAAVAFAMGVSFPAYGTVTFGVTPADGDTVALNGVTFTFRDAPVGGSFDVQTHPDVETAVNNLITKIGVKAAEPTPEGLALKFGNYSQPSPGGLQVQSYYQPPLNSSIIPLNFQGYDPNAYTLAASVATVSGPMLEGANEAAYRVSLTGLFGLLPTEDPVVLGAPWVDSTADYVVKVSQG